MATLKEMGIPADIYGILQPHIKWSWQIRFIKEDGSIIPGSEVLTRQAIKISSIKQEGPSCLSRFGLITASSKFKLTFEEDILNKAMDSVQYLYSLEDFNIAIDLLTGDGQISRTTTIKNAKISKIKHGDLDYAGGRSGKQSDLNLRIPEQIKDQLDLMSADSLGAFVVNLFTKCQISVSTPSSDSSTIRSVVTFTFQDPITIENYIVS
jgi:hypothetical protein